MHQLLLIALVILGLPLLSFLLIVLNQKALRMRAHLVGVPMLAFAFVLAIYVLNVKLRLPGTLDYTFNWIDLGFLVDMGPLIITNGLQLSNLTAILVFVAVLISMLTHITSIEYLKGDVRYTRYAAYLGLLTFSLIGVLLANNFLALYMFFELLAFAAYGLISHCYERRATMLAGKEYFVLNRVGDVCLWIGLLLLYSSYHSFAFRDVFPQVQAGLPGSFNLLGVGPATTLTITGILLLAGVAAKCAQFPLHVWSIDLREAPIPASAFVAVASAIAGVYLSTRVFPLLTEDALNILIIAGGVTGILSGLAALFERRSKLSLIYTSAAQVSLIVMAVGAGVINAALFHLATFAIFSTAAFLALGAAVRAMERAKHAVGDYQTDVESLDSLGGLFRKMPVTAYVFVIASLGAIGMPLLGGFLSKSAVISGIVAYSSLEGLPAIAIPYVAYAIVLLIAIATVRQCLLVFFGRTVFEELYSHVRETPLLVRVPLIVLAVCSVWLLYGLNPIDHDSSWFMAKWVKTPAQITPGTSAPYFGRFSKRTPYTPSNTTSSATNSLTENNWQITLPTLPSRPSDPIVEEMPLMSHQTMLLAEERQGRWVSSLIALGVSLAGALLGWLLYRKRSESIATVPGKVSQLFANRLYLEEAYDYLFVGSFLLASRGLSWFNQHVLDGAINGIGWVVSRLSKIVAWIDEKIIDGIIRFLGGLLQLLSLFFRSIQTGKVQTYMAWTLTSIAIVFVILQVLSFGF